MGYEAVSYSRAADLWNGVLLYFIFLYGIPLSWVCKLLEEACLDRAADHDRRYFGVSVKSGREVY